MALSVSDAHFPFRSQRATDIDGSAGGVGRWAEFRESVIRIVAEAESGSRPKGYKPWNLGP